MLELLVAVVLVFVVAGLALMMELVLAVVEVALEVVLAELALGRSIGRLS